MQFFSPVSVILFAGAAATAVAHFLMEPLRWRLAYMPHQANNHAAAGDAILASALASYVLPFKLGIPLRALLLHRRAGLALQYVGVVIALDGLMALCVWTAWVAVCVWGAALHWMPPAYVWPLAFAVAVGCMALLAGLPSIRSKLIARWKNAFHILDRPWRRCWTAASILAIDVLSYAVRHALLVWLVVGDPALILAGSAIGVAATFAGLISGLPMGLLGYDASLVAMFATIGVGAKESLAIIAINRFLNLAIAVVLGVPAAARLGLGAGITTIVGRFRELANDKE